jgi:hypothetical protein
MKERRCKECLVIIDYVPRRVRCVECYKKYISKPISVNTENKKNDYNVI